MARISLREYIHEIESQVDRGETQKAVAHCKHILKFYPKHIDTYRLFGKALLEMQKYGDASDIFQRVLSSVPDDFISQIGMSIIREDENNLDAAIWHLERAFEIQPSNKAVQDELKRLYTDRDGTTPTKIRLTRGALVRMYARGELYSQAISEIRAALSEDPNRVDLEVILARLYFNLGQKVEATETCSNLIARLPFCYEANQILAALLPGTSREEDAKIFRQRVIDLDPYYEYVSEATPISIDIPDNKVVLEMLDYEPGQVELEQPDWAKSIGINWELETTKDAAQIESWLKTESVLQPEQEKEAEPSFLAEEAFEDSDITMVSGFAPGESDAPAEEVEETSAASEVVNLDHQEQTKEEIPEWMAEAGWQVTDAVDETAEKGFNIPEEPEPAAEVSVSDEIEPGTIPDWIKNLAPKELSDESALVGDEDIPLQEDSFEFLFAATPTAEESKLVFEKSAASNEWLNEFSVEEAAEVEKSVAESIAADVSSQPYDEISISFEEGEFSKEFTEELPVAVGTVSEFTEEQPTPAEIVSEFNEINPEEEAELHADQIPEAGESAEFASEPEPGAEFVSELAGEPETAEQTPRESSLEELSLGELTLEDLSEDKTTIAADIFGEEIPDMPTKILESYELPTQILDSHDLPEGEMTWLDDLIQDEQKLEPIMSDMLVSPDQGYITPEELDLAISEGKGEADFAWLNALQEDLGDKAVSISRDEVPSDLQQEMAELFGEEPASPAGETVSTEPAPKAAEAEKLAVTDEEMQDVISSAELDVSDLDLTVAGITLEEKTPDWVESLISEIPDEAEEIPQALSFEGEADEKPFVLEEKELESEGEGELDAALAWMEGLAARHGATEETLASEPAERAETPPDWIKALQTDSEAATESDQGVDKMDAANVFGDDLTPSWLQELQLEAVDEEESNVDFLSAARKDLEAEAALDVQPKSQVDESRELPDFFKDEDEIAETPATIKLQEFETIDEEYVEEVSPEAAPTVKLPVYDRIEVEAPQEEPEEMADTIFRMPEMQTEEPPTVDEEAVITGLEAAISPHAVEEVAEAVEPSASFESMPEVMETEETHPEGIAFEDNQPNPVVIEEMYPKPAAVKLIHQNLQTAKQVLYKGNIDEATAIYDQFIRAENSLDEIISELKEALDHSFPISIPLWQSLGDAYVRKNQLQNALDAYSKAEELLA